MKVTKYCSNEENNSNNFENPGQQLDIGIRIQNLEKVYKNGKVAVDGVTLDIYKDQITALLGHNGAGKTTTMSILTGMLPSSKGSVWIDGYNIATDMSKVRESLGLCPQHNMLFSDLTVMEHLIFFAMLKGVKKEDAEASANELLRKVQLSEKAFSMTSKLSGGMKRKLSLAIALIGNSKVVMLDEPTSGMDPEARRHIWDLLLSMRGQRTIMITTHFMEEADVLGDKIAIMNHGRVQCYGSSMFLKNQYGAGYVLRLLTREPYDEAKLTDLVQSYVSGSKLKSRLGSELSYTLPLEQKPQFSKLFNALEIYKQDLGINSMGVSLTSLEDVFLRVGNRVAEQDMKGKCDSQSFSEIEFKDHTHCYRSKTTGLTLVCQQMKALCRKKAIFTYRKWFLFLVQATVPILLTLLAFQLSFLVFNISHNAEPSRLISLTAYDASQVIIVSTTDERNLSKWYEYGVNSAGSFPLHVDETKGVISGLINQGEEDVENYRANFVVSSEMLKDTKTNKLILTALYSGFAYHSAAISINLMSNTLLKSLMNSNDYSITTINHPLEIEQVDNRSMTKTGAAIVWQQLIPLGLLLMIGYFVIFPLVERVSKAKHLQVMSGVSPLNYWISSFLWDFLTYLPIALVMVILLPLCDQQGYFGGIKEAGIFAVILLTFGLSGIPYAYMFSYFKQTTASGVGLFVGINFVIGAILPWVISTLELVLMGSVTWMNYLNCLTKFLCLIPSFTLSYSIMNFAEQAAMNNDCTMMTEAFKNNLCLAQPTDPCCTGLSQKSPYLEFQSSKNPLAIGWPLTFLVIDFFLYFIIILVLDYGFVPYLYEKLKGLLWDRRFRTESDEVDADVRMEMNRVQTGMDNVLTVKNLTKVYGRKVVAVQGVSFGVRPGECFGLLGFNGAGKTSTFKMLTGDEIPTRGDAWINTFNLNNNHEKAKYLSQIGYCPQFDAFNESLTGREMLNLFAELRGVHNDDVDIEVDKWLKLLGLLEYQDKLCGSYSGGNKRKLSTAMALIGDPLIVFLDEPTSGVDPVARRNLWSVLAKLQKTNRAIVLTSHSMDECEALCNKLAIMVKGQFVCFGGIQHLKKKFGQGFTVMIRLGCCDAEDIINVKDALESAFSGCILKDEHKGLLHYHLTDPHIPWAALFTKMEALKNQYDMIDDYAISETTLEQVFLSFAQISEDETLL